MRRAPRWITARTAAWTLLFLTAGLHSGVGEAVTLRIDLGEEIEILRRWNVATRVDGRYAGHTFRESRLLLTREESIGDLFGRYRAELLASENTIRDVRTTSTRVAAREVSEMTSTPAGVVFGGVGALAPLVRGLPTFPAEAVSPGATWEAPGAVIFWYDGDEAGAIPVVAGWRYVGVEAYAGELVHRIEGGYAVRAPVRPGEQAFELAAPLVEGLPAIPDGWVVRGTHEVTLLLPVDGGPPLLHRTAITEQVRNPERSIEERSGFLLIWYRGGGTFAAPSTAERIRTAIAERNVPEVEVEEAAGNRVVLAIRNLQFVADQAVLLPGERGRLDEIAALLATVPDQAILVTGHTADVGSVESQVALSIERARVIVDELAARGIAAGRLRYNGRGGSEPVGDNATPEGRARNRRVEITILPAAP